MIRTGIKRGLRLSEVPDLSPDVVDRLAKLSISTSEEFLSQYVSDREAVVKYLGRTPEEVKLMVDRVSRYLDPKVLKEIYSSSRVARPLGARRPHSKEDEEYFIRRRSEEDD